ncbi:MAG: sigma-70 family RNA polymerase sigma factor [Caldimonas sp.]
MPTNTELSELVAAVGAHGDRQAFALLFKHFAPRIATYLVRGGTAAAKAEELAQEAMVVLWCKSASFDPSRAGVSTWLFTIARNLRIDSHRRGGAEAAEVGDGELAELPDPAPAPDEQLGAAQRERRVRAALQQLPAEQARIVELSYFADQAHAAIAHDLRIPLGTVKSRMRLAVNNLRRLIDAMEP